MPPRPVEAADKIADNIETILFLGKPGTGKSSQIVTLPGRKFVYAFDPNTISAIQGYANTDVVRFFPKPEESELRLKGFNSGSKSDRTGKAVEPLLYEEWREDHNARLKEDFFRKAGYDWLCLDSWTWFIGAMEARQLWLDGRPGESGDKGDFKVMGMAAKSNFDSLRSAGCHLFMTGHFTEYQSDITKKIIVQANLPGKSRTFIPGGCTNVWLAERGSAPGKYNLRTFPESNGCQDIRNGISGLKELEDVTIPVNPATKKFIDPQKHGIGALLKHIKPRVPVALGGDKQSVPATATA